MCDDCTRSEEPQILQLVATPEQLEEFHRRDYVTERAPSGQVWRFFSGYSGAAEMSADCTMYKKRYCVATSTQPTRAEVEYGMRRGRGRLTYGDNIAAFLLILRSEGGEAHIREVSNLM